MTNKKILIYFAIGILVYYLAYRWYRYSKCDSSPRVDVPKYVQGAPPCNGYKNFWKG